MKNSLVVTCLAALLTVTAGAALASATPNSNNGNHGNGNNGNKSEQSVPEPATVLLLGAGTVVAIGARRFWTKRK